MKQPDWTPEEDEKVVLYYPEHGPSWSGWVEVLPGRTRGAISQRASHLGVTYEHRSEKWTPREIGILANADGRTPEELCELLPGRSREAIFQKARKLGVVVFVPKKPWTKEEDDLIGEYYRTKGADWAMWEIYLPDRTRNAIRMRAGRLGIHYYNSRWRPEEDAKVRELYPLNGDDPYVWDDALPGRTVESIVKRARVLNVAYVGPNEMNLQDKTIRLNNETGRWSTYEVMHLRNCARALEKAVGRPLRQCLLLMAQMID